MEGPERLYDVPLSRTDAIVVLAGLRSISLELKTRAGLLPELADVDERIDRVTARIVALTHTDEEFGLLEQALRLD